jgi:hypothetical protein
MTAMYEDSSRSSSVVGYDPRGHLPEPAVKSDMQVMQDNERKQHEQTYIYENGHNDHGMGQ